MMASRPKHPCRHRRCSRLVRAGDGGYCEEHRRESAPAVERRTKAVDPFYKTRAWRELRAVYFRAHPLCEKCGAHGKYVHHIDPIADGGEPLDEENLETLCTFCHGKEHGGAP